MEGRSFSALKSLVLRCFRPPTTTLEAGHRLRPLVAHRCLRRGSLARADAVSLADQHHAEAPLRQHSRETAFTRPQSQLLRCIVPVHWDGRMDALFVAVTVVLILIQCEVPTRSRINSQLDWVGRLDR